jgi:hypothetical protein
MSSGEPQADAAAGASSQATPTARRSPIHPEPPDPKCDTQVFSMVTP